MGTRDQGSNYVASKNRLYSRQVETQAKCAFLWSLMINTFHSSAKRGPGKQGHLSTQLCLWAGPEQFLFVDAPTLFQSFSKLHAPRSPKDLSEHRLLGSTWKDGWSLRICVSAKLLGCSAAGPDLWKSSSSCCLIRC